MTFHKIEEERFEPSEIWYNIEVNEISRNLPIHKGGIVSFLKQARGNLIYSIPTLYKQPITLQERNPRLIHKTNYKYSVYIDRKESPFTQRVLPIMELRTLEEIQIDLSHKQQVDLLFLLNDNYEPIELPGWKDHYLPEGFFGIFSPDDDPPLSGFAMMGTDEQEIPQSLRNIVNGIFITK